MAEVFAGQPFQYKTVKRTWIKGQQPADAADVLNVLGADGWELVAVQLTEAALVSEWIEVFYLKKAGQPLTE